MCTTTPNTRLILNFGRTNGDREGRSRRRGSRSDSGRIRQPQTKINSARFRDQPFVIVVCEVRAQNQPEVRVTEHLQHDPPVHPLLCDGRCPVLAKRMDHVSLLESQLVADFTESLGRIACSDLRSTFRFEDPLLLAIRPAQPTKKRLQLGHNRDAAD